MKRCTKCHQVKSFADYYKAGPGYHSYCKACFNEYGTAWKRKRRSDPAFREYERQKRLEHNARNPSKRVRKQVGMSVVEFERLRALQGNRCAICRREFDDTLMGRPRLDHDHETNEVRGLLCHGCNIGIGAFRDSPALVARALWYLEQGGDAHHDAVG